MNKENVVYICTMEYYSVLMYFFATTWMNAEDIMLHEINQKKKSNIFLFT